MIPTVNATPMDTTITGASNPSPAIGGKPPWDSGLDVVRVMAVFLVVCIHCNSYFAQPVQGVYSIEWMFACMVASVSRICVPLFFMISGYLLLKPGVEPLRFYQRRLGRIGLPLLAWSVIYVVVRVHWQANQISLLSACRLLYNGEIYYHLGFLYSMAGLYLALPFLAPLAAAGRERFLLGFAGLTFLLASLLPFGDRWLTEFSGFPFHCGVQPGVFWIYAGYAAMGALARRRTAGRYELRAAGAIWIMATTATAVLAMHSAWRTGVPTEKWFGYHEPAVFLAAGSSFVLLRSVSLTARMVRIFRQLGVWSFGIYLSHPLVMEILHRCKWSFPAGSWIGLPLYAGSVFILSTAMIALMARIPILRQAL
jgi:surface polysaccharide O-acyltransferase-like enzyme